VGPVGGARRVDRGGVRRGAHEVSQLRGGDGSALANRHGVCFGGA